MIRMRDTLGFSATQSLSGKPMVQSNFWSMTGLWSALFEHSHLLLKGPGG